MKKPVLALVASSIFAVSVLVACSPAPAAEPAPGASTGAGQTGGTEQVAVDFNAVVAPAIKKNCAGCHAGEQPAGGKAFPADLTETWAKENGALMKESVHEMEEGKMPPANAPSKPTPEESKAISDWVKANIS